MKIFKLVKHDITEGTLKYFYRFIICVVIIVSQVIIYNLRLKNGIQYGTIKDIGTVMDYILYITKGEQVYNFSPKDVFTIPIYWFAFNIGISYIIAYYPQTDFDEYGKKVILAISSRNKWWLSKCIWCILTVLMYYAVALLTIMVMSMFCGIDMSFDLSNDIVSNYYPYSVSNLKSEILYNIAMLLPIFVTIAISMLQILLSFVFTPIISFASVCALYILSVYYTKSYLIGNYAMWIRSSYVDVNGLDSVIGFVLSMIIILSCITFGSMYFDKKDII